MDLKYTYYTTVYLLILCVLEQECAAAADCDPFGTPLSSQCTPADRLHTQFSVLDDQLHAAATYEDLPDFVVATSLGMYLFLHPCLQKMEAAAVLFYTEDGSANSLAQLVGRRKRDTFLTDDDLLRRQLRDLVQCTHAGCVQFLIEKYKNISAITFKSQNPNFHVQTTAAAIPTTTPTTTVSIATPITTPKVTTTPETTPSTEATTLISPVTYGPISCTSCSGLLCLLGNHVTQCPDGLFFCQTTVEETHTGRQLTRGCSSQALCDSFAQHQNHTLCSRADKEILDTGLTCRFCCVGHDCNRVPHVIPEPETLYPPRTSA